MDHYCEVCGQALRPGRPPTPEAADVARVAAAVQERRPARASAAPPPENGATRRQDELTRGPSRLRDHVEVFMPGMAGISDRGVQRSRNEDAVALGWLPELEAAILVVCDGVSSSESAALASHVAAETALASLTRTLPLGESKLEQSMSVAVADAQDAVCAIPHNAGGAKDPPSTTLVAAVIRDGHVTLGWVGDSRAYFVGAAGAWQLSQDDTWAAEEVALGRLTEHEAATDPRSHFLTRWLGYDPDEQPGASVRTFEIEWPGHVLLCSDGLWNYLPNTDRLTEMMMEIPEDASPEIVARSLTNFARESGGHDNITVVVAQVSGTRPGGDPW